MARIVNCVSETQNPGNKTSIVAMDMNNPLIKPQKINQLKLFNAESYPSYFHETNSNQNNYTVTDDEIDASMNNNKKQELIDQIERLVLQQVLEKIASLNAQNNSHLSKTNPLEKPKLSQLLHQLKPKIKLVLYMNDTQSQPFERTQSFNQEQDAESQTKQQMTYPRSGSFYQGIPNMEHNKRNETSRVHSADLSTNKGVVSSDVEASELFDKLVNVNHYGLLLLGNNNNNIIGNWIPIHKISFQPISSAFKTMHDFALHVSRICIKMIIGIICSPLLYCGIAIVASLLVIQLLIGHYYAVHRVIPFIQRLRKSDESSPADNTANDPGFVWLSTVAEAYWEMDNSSTGEHVLAASLSSQSSDETIATSKWLTTFKRDALEVHCASGFEVTSQFPIE